MTSRYCITSRHLTLFLGKQNRGASTLNSVSFPHRTMKPSTNFEATPLHADFIPSLQKPTQQILWIRCSDSCYQETTVLNLLPDEMLVHRNMGNMLIDGDMSSELTVKHAVAALQVNSPDIFETGQPNSSTGEAILVCGHYGCCIVRAESRDGLKGPWLR